MKMTSSSLGIKILFLQRETEISLCEYLLGGSGLRILPVGKQRRPAGCWPRVSAVGQLEGFLQPWTKGKKPNTEAERDSQAKDNAVCVWGCGCGVKGPACGRGVMISFTVDFLY